MRRAEAEMASGAAEVETTGMRSIPIDNRIYEGKLAREGDGIGDARVRANLEEMEASAVAANPQTLLLSLRLLYLRSLLLLIHLFNSLFLSLSFLFSSVSLIPISTFSPASPLLSSVG